MGHILSASVASVNLLVQASYFQKALGMLRKLFGWKPKPPTLPLEDRPQSPSITHNSQSASKIENGVEIRDVVDADFDEVVLQQERLVVVDFWAEWCQPCTIMSAYTEWLARDYGAQLSVVALDVDENPETPARYNILGLPTLLFIRGGVEVDRQVGVLPYEELQAKVDALLTQPS